MVLKLWRRAFGWSLASMFVLMLSGANATTAVPLFEDFKTTGALFHGPAAHLKLRSRLDLEFAAQLRSAAEGPANFARHYVLSSFGCGATCLMTSIIDLRTGLVTWLPFTVCCAPPKHAVRPIAYRLDSRLLVIHGSRNEKGTGTYHYVFNGRTVVLLSVASRVRCAQSRDPC